jgi:hypothetical protein
MSASTVAVGAQIGGKLVVGGNPTPGTAQPDPPNLADRIMLTGCLQAAPKSAANSQASEANAPSNARFVLSSAKRVDRNPTGTGGLPLATSSNSSSYRLEGIDSQFSPFVNTRVEISGEIKPPASSETGGNVPTILVEFVQKIAPSCR